MSRMLANHWLEKAATDLCHKERSSSLSIPSNTKSCTKASSNTESALVETEQSNMYQMNSTFISEQNLISVRRKLSEKMMLENQLAIQAASSNVVPFLPIVSYDARLLAHLILTSSATRNHHFIGNVTEPSMLSDTESVSVATSNWIQTASGWSLPSRLLNTYESQVYETPSHEMSSTRPTHPMGINMTRLSPNILLRNSESIKTQSCNYSKSVDDYSLFTCSNSDSCGCSVIPGHNPVELFRPIDSTVLSEYQCFVRKQIEFFEADEIDVKSNAKGRNKAIVLGQVGIRCRHCATILPRYRSRGAMYYPTKMQLIYQAAQNMVKIHIHQRCSHVPEEIQYKLSKLHKSKCAVGGGKVYWDEGAAASGVYEASDNCLRFHNSKSTDSIAAQLAIPKSPAVSVISTLSPRIEKR
jgi:hypothetical protein